MWIFHNEYTYFAGKKSHFLSVTDKITLFARILEGMEVDLFLKYESNSRILVL